MDAKHCIECLRRIPQARLAVLPDTETCVECSHVEPVTEDDWGVLDAADNADLLQMTRNNPIGE